jgi:glycosyltransferase involved in cell wall biosynthesis
MNKVNSAESEPLVSVILPTYNRAPLLRRSIQSVLSQTYSNLELLVVDDCSSDSTQSVVQSFRDKRIHFLKHEKKQGGAIARNTGIKAAKGAYIAFQDSDDEWLPRKLEKQMKAFEIGQPNLGVVFSNYWRINRHRKFYGLYNVADLLKLTPEKIHDVLLEENFVGTPMAVVRKVCFEKVGLFEALPRLQEWDLWIRISQHYSFCHINEPLVNVYVQPDSISHDITALIEAREYLLNKYFEEISKKPRLLSRHYFEIGTFHCLIGKTESGKNYLLKALRITPFEPKLVLSALAASMGSTVYDKASPFFIKAMGLEF